MVYHMVYVLVYQMVHHMVYCMVHHMGYGTIKMPILRNICDMQGNQFLDRGKPVPLRSAMQSFVEGRNLFSKAGGEKRFTASAPECLQRSYWVQARRKANAR